ncbi:unnamed protein product, partial [Prorocentrum cordatum]
VALCGLAQEQGIAALRACLADARGDETLRFTEITSAMARRAVVWGDSSAWGDIKVVLQTRLAPGSRPLPSEVIAVCAAHFRDADFIVPDPKEDAVIVHGGLDNGYGSAEDGCHFLPLLHVDEYRLLPPCSSPKWADMVAAVAARSGDLALESRVRDGGDCYFHALLVLLHFRGVLMLAPSGVSAAPGGASASLRVPDPTGESVAALQAKVEGLPEDEASNAIEEFLFLDIVFEGFKTKEEVYETVRQRVMKAWEDTRSHRQIASELDFDLRTIAPKLLADAVHTAAKARGLSAEALLSAVECNMGFIEAPGTKLTHLRQSGHYISPGQPLLIGSASSTRKSALMQRTDKWLTQVPEASPVFIDKLVMNTDCTTKGIRKQLEEHGRCGISSDEAANTFQTPFSDVESGVHYLSCAKLNTWTQSEHDGPATGNGKVSLDNYNFMLKCAGQTEVVEFIVMPKVHGFQKRMQTDVRADDGVDSEQSDSFIERLHGWMHEHCSDVASVLSLDGFAYTMCRAAKQAFDDICQTVPMPPAFKTKLNFFHSDLLRATHRVHRGSHFARLFIARHAAQGDDALASQPPSDSACERCLPSVNEITMGLHKVLRQIELHFGLCRFHVAHAAEGNHRSGGDGRCAGGSSAAVLAAPDVAEIAMRALMPSELMRQFLLTRAPKGQIFTEADARQWLRNKRDTWFRTDLAKKISDGLTALVAANLLDRVADSADAGGSTQRAKAAQGGWGLERRGLASWHCRVQGLPSLSPVTPGQWGPGINRRQFPWNQWIVPCVAPEILLVSQWEIQVSFRPECPGFRWSFSEPTSAYRTRQRYPAHYELLMEVLSDHDKKAVEDLQYRRIVPEDYELLSGLDASVSRSARDMDYINSVLERCKGGHPGDPAPANCRICMEDVPCRHLPCRHSFCSDCLVSSWSKVGALGLICPACRQDVPEGLALAEERKAGVATGGCTEGAAGAGGAAEQGVGAAAASAARPLEGAARAGAAGAGGVAQASEEGDVAGESGEKTVWQCVVATILSESPDLSSEVAKRLQVGDRLEGLAVPRMEGPVMRVHVRIGDKVGWVTLRSTSGKELVSVLGADAQPGAADGRGAPALAPGVPSAMTQHMIVDSQYLEMAVKGIKTKEYRGLKADYWRRRFLQGGRDRHVTRVRMRAGREKFRPEAVFEIVNKEVIKVADLADVCLPDRGAEAWGRLFGGCTEVLVLHLGGIVENRTEWRREVEGAQGGTVLRAVSPERAGAQDDAEGQGQGRVLVGQGIGAEEEQAKWRLASSFLSRRGGLVWNEVVEAALGDKQKLFDRVVDFRGMHATLLAMSIGALRQIGQAAMLRRDVIREKKPALVYHLIRWYRQAAVDDAASAALPAEPAAEEAETEENPLADAPLLIPRAKVARIIRALLPLLSAKRSGHAEGAPLKITDEAVGAVHEHLEYVLRALVSDAFAVAEWANTDRVKKMSVTALAVRMSASIQTKTFVASKRKRRLANVLDDLAKLAGSVYDGDAPVDWVGCDELSDFLFRKFISAEKSEKIRVPAAAFRDTRCFTFHFLDAFISQGVESARRCGKSTLTKRIPESLRPNLPPGRPGPGRSDCPRSSARAWLWEGGAAGGMSNKEAHKLEAAGDGLMEQAGKRWNKTTRAFDAVAGYAACPEDAKYKKQAKEKYDEARRKRVQLKGMAEQSVNKDGTNDVKNAKGHQDAIDYIDAKKSEFRQLQMDSTAMFREVALCGLAQEQGIAALRACLADARGDETLRATEISSAVARRAVVWGDSAAWDDMRDCLQSRLATGSRPLPSQVVSVSAAHFRDSDFTVPDPREDGVLVHGGLETDYESAEDGCHFLLLLHVDEHGQLPPCPSPKWADMVASVAGRSGDLALESRVRDGGDCYFHALLVLLHFRGVLLLALGGASAAPGGGGAGVAPSPPSPAGSPAGPGPIVDGPRKRPELASQFPPESPVSAEKTSPASFTSFRNGARFEDSLAESASSRVPDPTGESLAALQAIVEELPEDEASKAIEEFLFPDIVFEGFKTKEEVHERVRHRVMRAWEDTRSHRQIASELDFDLRTIAPKPLADAVHAAGKARGLSAEALLAAVECNMGFIEAPGTTLTHLPSSGHYISPGQPLLIGSASSTRKSPLMQCTDKWLTQVPEASPVFKDKLVTNTDCTTEGIRKQLEEHRRCGISSDEAANTFLTPFSDQESGVQYLSCAKRNTWTQSEYDGPATGNGKVSLDNYNFMLKCSGQTEVVEFIAMPIVHGFQKRMQTDVRADDGVDFEQSDSFIERLHGWMHAHCSVIASALSLDGYAYTIYRAAKQALDDICQTVPMPQVFKAKLNFLHSDLLRGTHRVHRGAQFARDYIAQHAAQGGGGALAPLPPLDAARWRRLPSVDDVAMGLHKVLRQIDLHFGLYRFHAAQKAAAAEGNHRSGADCRGVGGCSAAVLAAPDVAEAAVKGLTPSELTRQFLLIRAPKGQTFTAADARQWLRNKRDSWYRTDLAQKISDGLAALVAAHLVDRVAGVADAGESTSRAEAAPGKRTVNPKGEGTFKKRKLEAILADADATEERKRLRVNTLRRLEPGNMSASGADWGAVPGLNAYYCCGGKTDYDMEKKQHARCKKEGDSKMLVSEKKRLRKLRWNLSKDVQKMDANDEESLQQEAKSKANRAYDDGGSDTEAAVATEDAAAARPQLPEIPARMVVDLEPSSEDSSDHEPPSAAARALSH